MDRDEVFEAAFDAMKAGEEVRLSALTR